MYVNIISHNSVAGTSSGNVFDYLEKENQNAILTNTSLILEGRESEVNPNSVEHFFNQDFEPYDVNDANGMISPFDAAHQIDNNRGTQNLSAANFYMLNIGPSVTEQEHMEKIAIEELSTRGLNFEDVKDDPVAMEYFEEQKDQLIKLQMKLFTKDIMDLYAKQMNREIYSNQSALPTNEERKDMKPIIEAKYKQFLQDKGFNSLEKETQKVDVSYKKTLDYNLDSGKVFILEKNNKELSIFLPVGKFEDIGDNTVRIDESYFNERLQEAEDKAIGIYNSEDKVILDVEVKKATATKTLFLVNGSEEHMVSLWVNNKDFNEVSPGRIEMQKYRSDKLIEKAMERDSASKTLVEIPHIKNEITRAVLKKDGSEKNPEMRVFTSEIKGLKEPVQLMFTKNEVTEKDGKYFIEAYKYDFKLKNALSKGIEKEYGNIKDIIKDEVWKEAGFDVSKRKIEGKDLLYFAKVETERLYKHTDKTVIKNREIFKELAELKKNIFNQSKIDKLESQLLRDPHTNEIIKEGLKKGGLNYHTHIVVSRHDKTSINSRDKVSMSPNANQTGGTLNNGAKVGFNRVDFFKNIETLFDEKFGYQRPVKEQFKYINNENKYLKGRITSQVKNMVKQQIMKETGMKTVKGELMPIHQIKSQIMPLPIPTSLPKNKVDLAVKAVKLVMGLVKDRGIGY